jgi:tetratricopeptide (TPR) repeat protein
MQKSIIKPLSIDSDAPILKYHESTVPSGHKDYALHELMRGQLFFERGDYFDSDARFANACQVMGQIAGDKNREVAAVVWAESSKTYKGEPYEQATVHFYRGLCHYKLGDYSGALAAFRNSLACDAETRTKEQQYLEDFTISHFMAAMCYYQLGELDNAKAALRIAQRYTPGNQYLDPDVLSKNFIAIIAVGQGPYLIPSKIDVSIKRVDCPPCLENQVVVSIDEKVVGNAAEATDLFFQAKSQNWGEMDRIRLAKSIGRQAVSFVPYAGMGASLIRSEADFRCWWGLPRKYYIFATDVTPGLHTISLEFRSSEGQHLPRYDQVWFDVPVPNKPGEVYCFRSIRNSQNVYGMGPQTIGTDIKK